MNALQVAKLVASHPRVMAYRAKQDAFVRRMHNDYGPEFMNEGNGHEGVNRWTPAQRAEYDALMDRARNVRNAVRGAYMAHA